MYILAELTGVVTEMLLANIYISMDSLPKGPALGGR